MFVILTKIEGLRGRAEQRQSGLDCAIRLAAARQTSGGGWSCWLSGWRRGIEDVP